MAYHGDRILGTTFYFLFNTKDAADAPITLAGTPSLSAYEDGGTTQITAGLTLTVDRDGKTGMHLVQVDPTGGNGYEAGKNYDVVIEAGTVDGVSVVGTVVGSFSIETVSALRPTTAGRTLDVSAGGEAGVDWANVGSPTTAVNLSATNIDTDQVVASVTGAVGSVTGAVGSVTGNVGGNVVGSVGSVTGAVGSVAAGGITAASIATNAIDADALAADAVTEIQAGLSTLTTAQVNAEVVDALNVDTYAEIGQETPGATQTIRKMLGYLYKAWRNKSTQDATDYKLFNDDAATVDQKATASDDGTTFTRGEVGTGP